MCGICGQFNYRFNKPIERARVEKMMNTIIHRGPEDEGSYIDGSLGLGFRRLSIIDLTGGHQPMSNRDESIWVVFNGEIYNFQEIRQTLESHGHVFQTHSDTEVLVHGYAQWGEGILEKLNGMFGLAIWDKQGRKLVVARDPMGIKSLYFHDNGSSVLFGSEIRPAKMKVRMAQRKWLHRQVCHSFLPKMITARKKRSFAVNVVDDWFKTEMSGKMSAFLRDDQSLIYQYLKPQPIHRLLESHQSQKVDNHKILFSLALFEEWLCINFP